MIIVGAQDEPVSSVRRINLNELKSRDKHPQLI